MGHQYFTDAKIKSWLDGMDAAQRGLIIRERLYSLVERKFKFGHLGPNPPDYIQITREEFEALGDD